MEVQLKIFDFRIFLINLTHTEISYDGRDFGFGRQGVMVSPSQIDKSQFGFKLKRIVYAGISNVQPEAFDIFVRNSVLRFNRQTYNIFTRNCRHFSEFLLTELTPNQPEEGKYFIVLDFKPDILFSVTYSPKVSLYHDDNWFSCQRGYYFHQKQNKKHFLGCCWTIREIYFREIPRTSR